jgi:hypothetical protein
MGAKKARDAGVRPDLRADPRKMMQGYPLQKVWSGLLRNDQCVSVWQVLGSN